MAAPKGNKNALGCTTNGRPCKYDLEEMAIKIDEWSLLESSMLIGNFGVSIGTGPTHPYEWANRSDDFKSAFYRAKLRIAERWIKRLEDGKTNERLAMRYIKANDQAAKCDDRSDIEHAIEYKAHAAVRAATSMLTQQTLPQLASAAMQAIQQ